MWSAVLICLNARAGGLWRELRQIRVENENVTLILRFRGKSATIDN